MTARLETVAGAPVPATTAGVPVLMVSGISKTFPGTKALDDVELTLRSGRVTALLGHNGSGKSTLVKILAGVYQPDPGGQITDGDGGHGWHHRIHFIHQDLGLVPDLSVVENLDLGRRLGVRMVAPHARGERARARSLLAEHGLEHVDVTAPVRTLSPAERTVVAIARAMADWEDPRQILVLDEPTAALREREAEGLMETIRGISHRGAAVLYISHRLREVVAIADEAVVLRDGRKVGHLERGGFDTRTLVDLIAGQPGTRSEAAPTAPARGEIRLRIRGLETGRLEGVDLEVAGGEILGIAGVNGSGAEDLLGAVFGAVPRKAGRVDVDGVAVPGKPARAVRAGIGFVPADRRGHGAVLSQTARENLTLPMLRPLRTLAGTVSRRRERREVAAWFEASEVWPPAPERPFVEFSGGNQQKIVMSKWLRTDPRVVLVEEPTQGVDAGAQEAIYALLREAAAGGAAVVVASSDTAELVRLCGRVLVLNRGAIVAELTGDEVVEGRLIRLMLLDPDPTHP